MLTFKEYIAEARMNKIGKDQIAKAKEMGKKAFEDGKPAAPAANKDLMNLIGSRKPGETPAGEAPSTKIMKSYMDGWHSKNLP